MDVTLTRILSLLPHENGKIKRGSQKTFAQSIGYGSGDIVSMWINGTSQSYKKKLHQIADEYHVSVAWLKGETDDPTVEAEGIKETPATEGEGKDALDIELRKIWDSSDLDDRKAILEYAHFIKGRKTK